MKISYDFIFHIRLLDNLIKILLFKVWVNAPLNLEAFSHFLRSHTYYTSYLLYNLEDVGHSGDHVLVSGENRGNLPRNHKRRGYCFWSIFKVICHFHLAAILEFGERKHGNHFFLNPHVSKI